MHADTVMFRWVVDFFTALDLGRNNQLELPAGPRVQSGILAVIGGGPFRRTVDGGIAGNIAAKRPDHDDCARLEGSIRLEKHSGPAVVAGHRSMTIRFIQKGVYDPRIFMTPWVFSSFLYFH